jgi:hypothetical protein
MILGMTQSHVVYTSKGKVSSDQFTHTFPTISLVEVAFSSPVAEFTLMGFFYNFSTFMSFTRARVSYPTIIAYTFVLFLAICMILILSIFIYFLSKGVTICALRIFFFNICLFLV